MKVLAIDTAMGACAAALAEGGVVAAAAVETMARGHQERLGVLVRDLMIGAGEDFARLDRIAVTVGPGSFTGLRVGLAFALGLGTALDRPVVGVSALDALAASVPEAGGLTAALIDARRGQVYARLFRDGRPLAPPEALTAAEAAARLTAAHLTAAGGPVRLVGTGAALVAQALAETTPIPASIAPLDAPDIGAVARLAAAAEPADHPPRPLYLRAPDATPPSRRPGQPRT